jgi:hypothetical protein
VRRKIGPSTLHGQGAIARYKTIDTSPRFLPVNLSQQLLPATFEHALNCLLDQELDHDLNNVKPSGTSFANTLRKHTGVTQTHWQTHWGQTHWGQVVKYQFSGALITLLTVV